METDAYIALGSNLGERELNLLRAVAEIGKIPSCRVTGLSHFYETSPVGDIAQPLFLNAVLHVATGISPHDLLARLQHIENAIFARTRALRWGPRTIDLDLLLYGDEVINNDTLIVPHPRMTERLFVLRPLCDIAPELMHPILGIRMAELLAALRSDEVVEKI